MALRILSVVWLTFIVANISEVEASENYAAYSIYSHGDVNGLTESFEQRLQHIEYINTEISSKIEMLQQENKRLEALELKNQDEVQSLKKTVELLQNENNALSTNTQSIMKRMTAMETQHRQLMGKFGKRSSRGVSFRTGTGVAFSARLSHDLSNLGDGQPIVIDYTVTNDGGIYSNRTGVFTCTVPGMYVFFANQLTFPTKILESYIVLNGNNIAYIYSGDNENYSSGCNMVVVELGVGDEVWVKVHDHDTGLIVDDSWTTFSGFLLY